MVGGRIVDRPVISGRSLDASEPFRPTAMSFRKVAYDLLSWVDVYKTRVTLELAHPIRITSCIMITSLPWRNVLLVRFPDPDHLLAIENALRIQRSLHLYQVSAELAHSKNKKSPLTFRIRFTLDSPNSWGK